MLTKLRRLLVLEKVKTFEMNLSVIFAIFFNVFGEIGSGQPIAEIFNQDKTDLEYFIIAKRVVWNRAKNLCSNYGEDGSKSLKSRLASLVDINDRKWLAKMLSESDNRYDELWVDAARSSAASNWTWVEANVTVEGSALVGSYPEWYRGGPDDKTNCLAFGRLGHDMPVLLPSDCQREKPVLCVRTALKEDKTLKEGLSITVDDFNYTLYGINDDNSDDIKFSSTGVGRLNGGGVKWREARVECRKRGQHLAVIQSNEAAVKIANVMLRSRPSVENAWLGGWSGDGSSWVWAGIGEEIPTKKDPVTHYPPWLQSPAASGDHFGKPRCLALDRHACPEDVSPVFLELDCDKKRPFVCQQDLPGNYSPYGVVRSIPLADSILDFSEEPVTWDDGREYCGNKSGSVATIFDGETLLAVLDRMAQLHLDHIWVGARTKSSNETDQWTWVGEENTEIPKNKLGAVSWCLGIHQNEFVMAEPNSCLNLDRESHGLPLLYGLPCDSVRQIVLCRLPKSPDTSNNSNHSV